ncbi:hypothetical protein C3432_11765 [Citrobacter amalonaticus]|uniref:Uncharacterized protein n=1 Tax=Citrobacter amalonaticus TaxID=35703 RepID=A0A2S4RQ19_CITAM|nr:hypothetical protein [Citrobacter amalonaticus]POT58552.1 hypothetical protein C3432_11765 [Citrobacter amalonaticus]POT75922.1 hypothetical protein C3436_00050 [Citrobacter amalonaticus]POU59116.1 hypothetical protein C3430_26950 [Citrobacter amalonaticus]POV05157.1 hypothetical protein C3424_07355 [Citrobacter amalonaticus]
MERKNWLAEQTDSATMVFQVGKYCDDWKVSGSSPDGTPGFWMENAGYSQKRPENVFTRPGMMWCFFQKPELCFTVV